MVILSIIVIRQKGTSGLFRILLILLSSIPGAGLILQGRTVLGALLMVFGLFSWNLAFLGFFVWQGSLGPIMAWAGMVVGGLCTLASVYWTAVGCSPSRQRRLRERADRSLHVAMRAYLRGKMPEALVAVESGLRGSHSDVDLLFVGWQLACQLGESRQARRLLRRLRRADVEGKWDWEVAGEEERRGQPQDP